MKEKDIRDVGALNEYLRLVEEDTKKIFDFTKFKSVNCPGCKSQDFSEEFNKFGFIYVLCKDCRTLFVNPRPSFKELKEFYTNSESATFWVNEFFMPMADKRKTEIYRPQAEHVATSVLDKDKKDVVIGDIGSGYG